MREGTTINYWEYLVHATKYGTYVYVCIKRHVYTNIENTCVTWKLLEINILTLHYVVVYQMPLNFGRKEYFCRGLMLIF